MNSDHRYYARRVQQELDLAAAASDHAVKKIHLNMAAQYATMGEMSSATHLGSQALDVDRKQANEGIRSRSSQMGCDEYDVG